MPRTHPHYPLCVSGFPVDQVAGYRDHTVARSTGTLVILVDTAEFGLSPEDGGRTLLVCDPHSGILQIDTRALGRCHMTCPEEWCPYCMEEAPTLVRVPEVFYDDHASRDLPSGTEVRRTPHHVYVLVNPEERAELLSDARHYAAASMGYATDYPGLVASARATVKALDARP